MAITFKWSVSKVKVAQQDNKTNVVTNVEWLVQGTDAVNNLTAFASGVHSLTLGDTFVDFDKLTEQQVLNWCFEPVTTKFTNFQNNVTTVTKYLKDESEAQVSGQIARQLAQKAVEPALPWA